MTATISSSESTYNNTVEYKFGVGVIGEPWEQIESRLMDKLGLTDEDLEAPDA